jgi:hypothetical protein
MINRIIIIHAKTISHGISALGAPYQPSQPSVNVVTFTCVFNHVGD